MRMQVTEPRQHDQTLVDARVVLHRAGAERIEARVDAEVASRELGEVPEQLRLGELRQARRLRAPELLGNRGYRQVVAGELAPAPPGLRSLEDQLHPELNTSTRRSMSCGVRRSVTATSSASSSRS